MLAGAGLGDNATLAHATRQQYLSDGVVNFVRAGVKQILALQIDAGSAACFSQSLREEKRRGPSGKVMQQPIEFALKTFISARGFVGRRQFLERRHQSFGHEPAAITAPVTERIRLGVYGVQDV